MSSILSIEQTAKCTLRVHLAVAHFELTRIRNARSLPIARPTLKMIRGLLITLGLAACTLGLAAERSEAMLASLLSKDPKKPIVVLRDRVWSEDAIRIQPREVTGTPKDLPRSSRHLKLGSFKHDAGKGPVTLVIDYAGYLINPSNDAEATVSIGIECPETPNGCSYPIDKSALPFRTAFMAKQEVTTATGKRAVVVGRESHSYLLPPNATVEVRVSLLEPKNLEPLELKARLIYGEYDRRGLPGQPTKSGLLWKIIGGAIAVMLAAFWWLRRS